MSKENDAVLLTVYLINHALLQCMYLKLLDRLLQENKSYKLSETSVLGSEVLDWASVRGERSGQLQTSRLTSRYLN